MPLSEHERRVQALAKLGQVSVCLASAGALLVAARDHAGPDASALITAVRDDITEMLKDLDTIRAVMRDG
jgi:hypothetical protein